MWNKQKSKIHCLFKNYCLHETLCCSFCKIKNCDKRCTDDCKTCKYLSDEIYEHDNYELRRINESCKHQKKINSAVHKTEQSLPQSHNAKQQAPVNRGIIRQQLEKPKKYMQLKKKKRLI